MKNEPKSYSVKMYAELKLEDGRVIATEDEQFMIGSKVFAISDDGEASVLSAGSYTMENGNKMTIGDSSEILDLGEEKEAEDVVEATEELSEENTEELSEEKKEEFDEPGETPAEKADWAETYEKLKDRVAELEKAIFGDKAAEETEELSEETKTEMSKQNDFLGELMTEIEDLRNKVVELSGEPAEEGIKYNPEGQHFNSTIDLKKLSTKERAAYYINNK